MSKRYQFDGYDAYQSLRMRHADFLLDTFRIRPGPLADMLRDNWSGGGSDPFRLFSPLLVQGAFPFPSSVRPADLEAPDVGRRTVERPLHPNTVRLLREAGLTYPLYNHQVATIRAASEDRSVVLAAGTGSGKTEAFLIPLIDRLFWAQERGRDDLSQPGVRALIVYPLNALVNNQVQRIAELLRHEHQINFAFYTSRTKETFSGARRSYENRGRPLPPVSQILDRRALRGIRAPTGRPIGPPHILITNFSMLEYMLIRPLDRTIFLDAHLFHGAERHARLQTVVLDEAHVYAGAQAAEIHMLLRRAAWRFGTRLEALQGFATSATLSQGGSDGDAGDELARYAGDMFAKPSDRVASIVGHQHLPSVESPSPTSATLADPRDVATREILPESLRTLAFDEDGRPIALAEDEETALVLADTCVQLGLCSQDAVDLLAAADRARPAKLLFELLRNNERIMALRAWLFAREDRGLPTLDEVSRQFLALETSSEEARRFTNAVLRLGSLARRQPDEFPLIPARMHAFVRTPLGIWVQPNPASLAAPVAEWPWGEMSSMPPDDPTASPPRLPLWICSTCGEPYLQAWETVDGWGDRALEGVPSEGADTVLLRHSPDAELRLPADWGGGPYERVQPSAGYGHDRILITCTACAVPNVRLSPLSLRPRAAMGAIVDSIYPFLGAHPTANDERLPGDGRRMLTFSDSRRGAAEVAAMLENTHGTGLGRALIWTRLVASDEPLRVDEDLIDEVSRAPELREHALAEPVARGANVDAGELFEDLARLCVFQEFGRTPVSASTLETLGLAEVRYPRLPARPDRVTFLSDAEWASLLATILDDARRRGATQKPRFSEVGRREGFPYMVPPTMGRTLVFEAQEAADARAGADLDEPEDAARVIPLIPQNTPAIGRMFNFVERLLGLMSPTPDLGADALLRLVWQTLLEAARSPRPRWLRYDPDNDGVQIDLMELEIVAHAVPPFIDPVSRRLHTRSVRGLSPDRNAQQLLRALTDDEVHAWRNRHSVRRVHDADSMLGLWTIEHTAQLDVDELEEQEEAFRAGSRNVLSSSTTMEMGVDLGGLTFVLLNNVPPGPANYWQRAGRAGRRADGSSLVLTLAPGRPHDQLVFTDPRAFLARRVVPPRVRLDTPPLLARHVNAALLTAFFQVAVQPTGVGNPIKAFGTVNEFIVVPIGQGTVRAELVAQLHIEADDVLCDVFIAWLESLPEEGAIAEMLAMLTEHTVLTAWRVGELAASSANSIRAAVESAIHDLEMIAAQRVLAEAQGAGGVDESYLSALQHQERALLREPLISYLAKNGFLPSFGFPTEVVRLDTTHSFPRRSEDDDADAARTPSENTVGELRMERSLDLALSEYVPGCEVTANKHIHRAAGVVRNWLAVDTGTVRRLFYIECNRCGALSEHNTQPSACRTCEHPTIRAEEFLESARTATAGSNRASEEPDSRQRREQPTPVREYLRPSGFAVKLGTGPRRIGPFSRGAKRLSPARVRVVPTSAELPNEVLPGVLYAGLSRGALLFARSEGHYGMGPRAPGFGYAICQACGISEPENAFGGPLPSQLRTHRRLRGGSRCEAHRYWRNAVLGTSMRVDAFRVRFAGALAPQLPTPEDEDDVFQTLAACMLQVAANKLAIDSRSLHATIGTWRDDAGVTHREAIIYEPDGSGLLAALDEDPLSLVRDTVALLDHGDDATFIRFDTQFLVAENRFRLTELRAHFSDPIRQELLAQDLADDARGTRILRGRRWQKAVVDLFDDAARSVALQTARITEASLDQTSTLRMALVRAIRRVGPTRLLLGAVPDVSSVPGPELLVVAHLRRLIEDGVDVRVAADEDRGEIDSSAWAIVSTGPLGPMALGRRRPTTGSAQAPALDPGWLRGAVPVEATTERAQQENDAFEARWERGATVTLESLTRASADQLSFVHIREGDSRAEATYPPRIFADALGNVAALGLVEQIAYVDRYVQTTSVSLWQLYQVLQSFSYAPQARARIMCWPNEINRRNPHRDAQDLFQTKRALGSLNPTEAGRAFTHVRGLLRSKIGDVRIVEHQPNSGASGMRHPRKLLVKFAAGGALSTLKVLFDKGLDWAWPQSGNGPWPAQSFRAAESHIIFLRDPDLTLERDENGRSEWDQLF